MALVPPQCESGEADDDRCSDDDAGKGVGADSIGVVHDGDTDDGPDDSADEWQDARRVHDLLAQIVALVHRDHDDAQAEEHADGVDPIPATPLVIVAAMHAGEDLPPEVEAVALVDPADGDVVDRELGEAELEPA